MRKILEVGKYYNSIQKIEHISDEVIKIDDFNEIPKKIVIENYLVPFKVYKIEAIRLKDEKQLILTDDSLLKDEKGNLKHKEYDIEIYIDIALEDYNIDEIIQSFIPLTDEKEIEKFEIDYKKFSEYMDEMSDRYSDMYS